MIKIVKSKGIINLELVNYTFLSIFIEPGVANEILEHELKSRLAIAQVFSLFLHDLEKIS